MIPSEARIGRRRLRTAWTRARIDPGVNQPGSARTLTDCSKGRAMTRSLSALSRSPWTGRRYHYYRLDALEASRARRRRGCRSRSRSCWKTCCATRTASTVTADDIQGLAAWDPKAEPDREIAFRPSRVLLQDFTGVPAVVDLAAMRDAMKRMGGDPKKINPLQPVELVIDHSVQVDEAGTPLAFAHQRRAGIPAATASATRSSAGARTRSRTSGSSRPTPASSTR